MTTGRRGLVYTLLAVIVGGHVYDIVSGEEHWPFSPNPMYAHRVRQIGIRVLLGPSFVTWMLCNVFWVPWNRFVGGRRGDDERDDQSRVAAVRAAS